MGPAVGPGSENGGKQRGKSHPPPLFFFFFGILAPKKKGRMEGTRRLARPTGCTPRGDDSRTPKVVRRHSVPAGMLCQPWATVTNPLPISSGWGQSHTWEGQGWGDTGEAAGQRDNTAHGHTGQGTARGAAAPRVPGGKKTPKSTRTHTPRGDWSHLGRAVPRVRVGTSCGASPGRAGVRKETEKEVTVPWMGAGVKDGAEAMEA